MLETILEKYQLDTYIRCSNIIIELDGRGYAFPYITLSAWKKGKEENLLAQFLHEQLHWIEKELEELFYRAIEELKTIFTNVPINKPEGGGSEKSTYTHLIVCRFELLALAELLGKESAFRIVSGNSNYTWIRKTAINEGEMIDQVIRKYLGST
ncbi:MAG: hypothetical protein M3Q64_02385 [bacterium]|nr:hypothetical protein [bacterium]